MVQQAFLIPQVRTVFVHPFPPRREPEPQRAPHSFVVTDQARNHPLWRISEPLLERILRQLPLAANLHGIARFQSFEGIFPVQSHTPSESREPPLILRREVLATNWLFNPSLTALDLFDGIACGHVVVRPDASVVNISGERIDLRRLNNIRKYPQGMGQLLLVRDVSLLTGEVLGLSRLPSRIKSLRAQEKCSYFPKDLNWHQIALSFDHALVAFRLLMDNEYKGRRGYIQFYEDLKARNIPISLKRAYQVASALDPKGGPKIRRWGKLIMAENQEEAAKALDLLLKNDYRGPKGYRQFQKDMQAAGFLISLSKAYQLASSLDPRGGPRARLWGKKIITKTPEEEKTVLGLLNNNLYHGRDGYRAFHRNLQEAGIEVSLEMAYEIAAALDLVGGPKARQWGKAIVVNSKLEETTVINLLKENKYIGKTGYRAFWRDMNQAGFPISMGTAFNLAAALDPHGGPPAREWGPRNPTINEEEETMAIQLLRAKSYKGRAGYREFYDDMRSAGYSVSPSVTYRIALVLDPEGGPHAREWGSAINTPYFPASRAA